MKELRIGLVLYGGVSLAVYMNGIVTELWHALRASRARHDGDNGTLTGSALVYRDLLDRLDDGAETDGLRIVVDAVAGTSAGGVNGAALAKAVVDGGDARILNRVWIDKADIARLKATPEESPWWLKARARPAQPFGAAEEGAGPGRALGRWSYGIYILHMPVLVALCLGLQKAGDALGHSFFDADAPPGILPLIDLGPATDLAHLGSVALTVACAALAWRLVEAPGQALARQLARRIERGTLPRVLPHLAARITGTHPHPLPAPAVPSQRPGTPARAHAAPAAPSVARTAASPPPAHKHPSPVR